MNKEIELIDRAIESAKCRIYRLRANDSPSNTLAHQEKAKNQEELMEVTIKALEFYKESVIEREEGVGRLRLEVHRVLDSFANEHKRNW